MRESSGHVARQVKDHTAKNMTASMWRSQVRDKLAGHAPEAIEFLLSVMRNEDASDKDRCRAAMFIVDHAVGKPPSMPIDQNGDPAKAITGITVNFVSAREMKTIDGTATLLTNGDNE